MTSRRRLHRLVLLALGIGGIAAPALAKTSSITLAWDANSEPSVTGYIVYVGYESGNYREQYDTRNTTSFVYPRVVPGQRYYFAVAAYDSMQNVSPRSAEVSFLIPTDIQQPTAITAYSVTPDTVCSAQGGCYAVDRIATVPGYATSIARATDGRIFFVHDQTSIRVVDAAGLIHEPALTADSSDVAFADLVLDSEFARTGLAYVAEVVISANRGRELNIVRYREVGNVFGERAVIIAGLPTTPSGTAALAIDSAHRLYVALPADQYPSDPYEGMVLRFESDGSVPERNRAGSPVFARGYADPGSLEWDGVRAQLWLTGTGTAANEVSAIRLAVNDADPALSTVSTTRDGDVVLIDKGKNVVRINSGTDRAATAELISSNDLGGEPTSGVARDGDIYLSVVAPKPNSAPTSHILRLQRN